MDLLRTRGSRRQSRWLWVCGLATAALLVITPTTAGELPSSAVAACSGLHMPVNLLGYLWERSTGERPLAVSSFDGSHASSLIR